MQGDQLVCWWTSLLTLKSAFSFYYFFPFASIVQVCKMNPSLPTCAVALMSQQGTEQFLHKQLESTKESCLGTHPCY